MSQADVMLPFPQLRLLIGNHEHLAIVHSGRLSYGMLQVHYGMYESKGYKNKCELYDEDSNNAAHYHIPYCANQEGNTSLIFLLIISTQGSVITNTRRMITIQLKLTKLKIISHCIFHK